MVDENSIFDFIDQGYREYLLCTDPLDKAYGLCNIITAFHETAYKEARLKGELPPNYQMYSKIWLKTFGDKFDASVIEAALEEGLV